MSLTHALLILLTLVEIFLMGLIVVFFQRLKKSEQALSKLQAGQEQFLSKLRFNAQLEQEIVESFAKRQRELAELDRELEDRAATMRQLLKQAKELTGSPAVLRQVILAGHREGKSPQTLAKATGLSVEEVELILDQA